MHYSILFQFSYYCYNYKFDFLAKIPLIPNFTRSHGCDIMKVLFLFYFINRIYFQTGQQRFFITRFIVKQFRQNNNKKSVNRNIINADKKVELKCLHIDVTS